MHEHTFCAAWIMLFDVLSAASKFGPTTVMVDFSVSMESSLTVGAKVLYVEK